MTPSNGHVTLHEELVLGRRALLARFRSAPTRTLAAGELLTETGSSHAIYHLTTGWACQFREFSDADLTIVRGSFKIYGTRTKVGKIYNHE
jgi:hypothetical protein